MYMRSVANTQYIHVCVKYTGNTPGRQSTSSLLFFSADILRLSVADMLQRVDAQMKRAAQSGENL